VKVDVVLVGHFARDRLVFPDDVESASGGRLLIRGRTGRGDTCFATYVARRLEVGPEEACRFAAAVTSLKMEHPGPYRGSRADVEQFLARRPDA